MSSINETERQYLIELLEAGEDIPQEYKNLLFPPERQEYELVYAGKEREEDILADTMAVPLQSIRSFGSGGEDWRNLLIFGDNLQAMKTLLKWKEQGILVNADGSPGVKLVYIDPPFGTGDEYSITDDLRAYSAKLQGSKFIEFLRKRLILLRELLADNGSIYIRIDYHFGHYIKVIADEVFGAQFFRNEIVINRFKRQLRGLNQFNVATDTLFLYSKSSDPVFNEQLRSRICSFCGQEKAPEWHHMLSSGLRNPPDRVILGRRMYPPRGQHWKYTQLRIDEMEQQGRIRIDETISYVDMEGNRTRGVPEFLQTEDTPVDSNWTDLRGYVLSSRYPTENPEELLERVIRSSSNEGDIVMDAFAGSGTTCAVAEKLKHRWVGIDSSKLSIYTIQKRMLNLKAKIGNTGKTLKPAPFTLCNAGLYDFSRLRDLPWDGWRSYALGLFQCQDSPHKIKGIVLDGYRDADDVLVFNHTLAGGVMLDYGFIENLHADIGSRLGNRFFIIAPAASVAFLEDYVDLGSTRYYVLRIPYSIINELHSRDFEAITQPVDEAEINTTVEAIGFDFIRQPDVECTYLRCIHEGQMFEDAIIHINAFRSTAMAKGASLKGNLETLSMVLVDYDYPYNPKRTGDEPLPPFELDAVYYANDLRTQNWEVQIPLRQLGDYLMIVYLDIYGNEYTEIKAPTDFKGSD